MNKKRILVWVLTSSIVASASAVTYASQKTDSTKNVVVTIESKSGNNVRQQGTINDEDKIKEVTEVMKKLIEKDTSDFSKNKIYSSIDTINQSKEFNKEYKKEHLETNSSDTISDEEAIERAKVAMNEYMGIDPNYFSKYQILRSVDVEKQSQQYAKEHPQELENLSAAEKNYKKSYLENNTELKNDRLITIWFTPKNFAENSSPLNHVFINEKNGEVVNIAAINYKLDKNLQVKIDDNKVKDTTFNFLKKIGKGIKGNIIKIEKQIEFGTIIVHCTLDDGRDAEFEINPQNYSVVVYRVNYNDIKTMYSEQKETRDIQIN